MAAGAGCFVTKHGNRASSSSCGSADILEALGARLNGLHPNNIDSTLKSSKFTFLFSQFYHPAMQHVSTVRKELGIKTVFNMFFRSNYLT